MSRRSPQGRIPYLQETRYKYTRELTGNKYRERSGSRAMYRDGLCRASSWHRRRDEPPQHQPSTPGCCSWNPCRRSDEHLGINGCARSFAPTRKPSGGVASPIFITEVPCTPVSRNTCQPHQPQRFRLYQPPRGPRHPTRTPSAGTGSGR